MGLASLFLRELFFPSCHVPTHQEEQGAGSQWTLNLPAPCCWISSLQKCVWGAHSMVFLLYQPKRTEKIMTQD